MSNLIAYNQAYHAIYPHLPHLQLSAQYFYQDSIISFRRVQRKSILILTVFQIHLRRLDIQSYVEQFVHWRVC
jgi:hypothetical protein